MFNTQLKRVEDAKVYGYECFVSLKDAYISLKCSRGGGADDRKTDRFDMKCGEIIRANRYLTKNQMKLQINREETKNQKGCFLFDSNSCCQKLHFYCWYQQLGMLRHAKFGIAIDFFRIFQTKSWFSLCFNWISLTALHACHTCMDRGNFYQLIFACNVMLMMLVLPNARGPHLFPFSHLNFASAISDPEQWRSRAVHHRVAVCQHPETTCTKEHPLRSAWQKRAKNGMPGRSCVRRMQRTTSPHNWVSHFSFMSHTFFFLSSILPIFSERKR